MENQHGLELDPMEAAREKLIGAALPHVVFDGWSEATLEMAIADAAVDPGVARLVFPRGGVGMAVAFHRLMDRRLAEELEADPTVAAMKIRERVTHGVRRRLELVAAHREAVRRAATLFALPLNAPDGARLIWETADTIWTAIGDTSTDYNWYTKRAILSSVYSATMLYWLGDETPGQSATWSFLERRIDEVMRFEKFKAQVNDNPLAKAAMWAPSRVLELIGSAARRGFARRGSGMGAGHGIPGRAPGPMDGSIDRPSPGF